MYENSFTPKTTMNISIQNITEIKRLRNPAIILLDMIFLILFKFIVFC